MGRVREFEKLCTALTQSKSSIKGATKAALVAAEYAEDVVKILLECQRKAADRLSYFFLLDSILKSATIKGLDDFPRILKPRLANIGLLAVEGASQKVINTVHKVMGYWVQRDIYDTVTVDAERRKLPRADGEQKVLPDHKIFRGKDSKDRKSLESTRQADGESHRQAKKERPHDSKKRCRESEDAEADKVFAKIERERRNKDYVNRFERDVTEGGGDDFSAMWGGDEEVEEKKQSPSLEKKSPSLPPLPIRQGDEPRVFSQRQSPLISGQFPQPSPLMSPLYTPSSPGATPREYTPRDGNTPRDVTHRTTSTKEHGKEDSVLSSATEESVHSRPKDDDGVFRVPVSTSSNASCS